MRTARRLRIVPLLAIGLTQGRASAAPAPERLARRVELRLTSTTDVRAVATEGDLTWAATSGGLLRIGPDGSARVLTGAEGVPPGRLHALLLEEDGSLWVGGEGGLTQIAARAGRYEPRTRVPTGRVRALARYRGRLFLGTWDQGLLSVGAGETRARPHAPALEAITALAATPEGLYVASATRGLSRYDGQRWEKLETTPACRTVWALAAQGSRLWVGTLSGLALVETRRGIGTADRAPPASLPVKDLRALLAEAGGLAVGSFGGGLHLLSREGDQAVREPRIPATARVQALARGPRGLVVGTSSGLYLERDGALTRVAPEGPASNDLSALAASRQGLWVGTFDAGLSLYREGRWQHFDQQAGLVDDWVNHLAVQEAGGQEVLWVATPRGVSRYDGRSWQSFLAGQELAEGHVNAIDARGERVFFASSKGIAIYKHGRWQRLEREQGLPLRNVTAIRAEADGSIWAGGMDGLARYHAGRWQRFQVATGELPDDWVTALALSSEGLWVGTYNRGLALGGSTWRVWGPAEGMPCAWVNAQALSWIDGRLWIGSLEGGLLVLTAGARRSRWQRLDLDGGLPSMDVTAIAGAEAGRIWVATRGGLMRLGPEPAGAEEK